jgi:hypothetical protein
MLERPLPHAVLGLGWGAGAMLVAALLMIVGGRLYDASAEQGLIVLGAGGFATGAASAGAAGPGVAPTATAEIRSWPSSWPED